MPSIKTVFLLREDPPDPQPFWTHPPPHTQTFLDETLTIKLVLSNHQVTLPLEGALSISAFTSHHQTGRLVVDQYLCFITYLDAIIRVH